MPKPSSTRLVAALAAVAAAGVACNSRPKATIHDTAFVAQANAVCTKALPPLRAQKKETDFFGNTPKNDREAVAAQVEKAADGLDDVAAQLGALQLRAADQGEVAAWLEEWANYTGLGRQYAAAVRTQRASEYSKIARESNGPVGRIARFARANHIDGCVL